MKATLCWFAVVAVLGLAPSTAEAQRHRSSGNVNTPYGTFSMQEMMAAGGDPSTAQEIRAEKLMMQQQQQYMAQMAKQQKATQDYLKKHPEAAKAAQASTNRQATTPTRAAKKAKTKAKVGSDAGSTAAADSTKAVAGAPPAVKGSSPK